MIGKFMKDGIEHRYYVVDRYKNGKDDIIGGQWKKIDYEDYYILYNLGLLNFMDSYWLEGMEYYGRNGVKWLGYKDERSKHGIIMVEIL
jgi:hypothetical protein